MKRPNRAERRKLGRPKVRATDLLTKYYSAHRIVKQMEKDEKKASK